MYVTIFQSLGGVEAQNLVAVPPRMRMVTLVMSISNLVFAPRCPVVSGPCSLRIMCSSRDAYQITPSQSPLLSAQVFAFVWNIYVYKAKRRCCGASVRSFLPDLLHWLASDDHYRNVSVQNHLLIVNSNSFAVSSVELECTTENPHTYRLAECRLALRRYGKRLPCFYRPSFYSHFASSPFGMIEYIV